MRLPDALRAPGRPSETSDPTGAPGEASSSLPGRDDTSAMVSVALRAAHSGLHVFPNLAGTKHPHIKRWPVEATTGPDRIRAWWRKWPDASPGVALGPSGYVVLDEDAPGELKRAFDEQGWDWVETYAVTTGREGGGTHFWFAQPTDGSVVRSSGWFKKRGYKVDVKGDGGQAIAEGAVHESGAVYTAANDLKPQPFPKAVLEALRTAAPSKERATERHVEWDGDSRWEGVVAPTGFELTVINEEAQRLVDMAAAATDDAEAYQGEPWNQTTFDVACNLLEVANSDWSEFTVDDAEALLQRFAPRDAFFTDTDVEERFASAMVTTAGKTRPVPNELAADDPSDDRWDHFVGGGSFLFDDLEFAEPIWGTREAPLWVDGEALTLAGSTGVGKSTLTQRVVLALLGLDGPTPEVLGEPVRVLSEGEKVLYLAMDRPAQVSRSMRRMVGPADRETLDARLMVWKGPPVEDMAKHTGVLLELTRRAGASVVIVDSLKDAASPLSEDGVSTAYNRARQTALTAGVQVFELHHLVKKGANGGKPRHLSDLYGGVWLVAGSGSVVLLHGEAGDTEVELNHLKQPAGEVGPFLVVFDHRFGLVSRVAGTDPLALLRAAGSRGLTAAELASKRTTEDKPTDTDRRSARRDLGRLETQGYARSAEVSTAGGGNPTKRYYATGDEQGELDLSEGEF